MDEHSSPGGDQSVRAAPTVRFDPVEALTNLARAAAWRPHYAGRLHQALSGRLAALAEPAIRVALAEGGPLGQTLARVVAEEADGALSGDILALIPPGVPSLGAVALAALDRREAAVAAGPDAETPEVREELGRLSFNRVDWLYAEGRFEEGVAASERALDLFRSRYEDGAGGFIALVAAAGSAAAAGLERLGRRDEALERSRAAVEVLAQVVAVDPVLFGPFYGDAQLALSHRLSTAGDYRGAADAAAAAVATYRSLPPEAGRDRDWLGEALNAQSLALARLARHGEAVDVAATAVDQHRQHAETRAFADRVELSGALNTLALRLRRHGRMAEALEAVEEAIGILRACEAERPGPFAAALAGTVNSLALIQADQGDHESAIVAARECRDIFTLLETAHPGRFGLELGRAWNTLAGCLTAQDSVADALEAARMALAILRDAAKGADQEELALAHYRIAELLHALDHHDEALTEALAAQSLFRALFDGTPSEAAHDLALVLTLLAMIRQALGDAAAAVADGHAVMRLLHGLAASDPVAYLNDIGRALNNHGHDLMAVDDVRGAYAAFIQAERALERDARLTGRETSSLARARGNRERVEAWLAELTVGSSTG